jgi:acyl-coenzyme A thioesterase PaaI-like protein
MKPPSLELSDQIMILLKEQHGDDLGENIFPPPVFSVMQGQFLDYDPEQALLSVRFPVLESWLNPYGMMQGGMLAAAIDNTIGPLSALVAPVSVTRQMELKYSQAVTLDAGFVIVTAHLIQRQGRWLTFRANANDPQGQRLARARAKHWILDA